MNNELPNSFDGIPRIVVSIPESSEHVSSVAVTPEEYGAVGNGATDDKAAIESMLAQIPDNALVVMKNNYYISDGITITRPVNIQMYGKFIVKPSATYGIKIQGHNVRRNTFRLNLETSSATGHWGGTYNTIGIDLDESWENTYDISVQNFTTGIRLISGDQDCTYNKVFIRSIFNCKTAILLTGKDDEIGGTTAQNTFIGGRIGCSQDIMTSLIESDPTDCYYPLNSVCVGEEPNKRTNNNNNFISVSFECGFKKDIEHYENRAIIMADMLYCAFIGCRFEGVTQCKSTWYCSVISGYGFDSVNYTTIGGDGAGRGTVLGVNKSQITTYTQPIKIQRTGDANGDVLTIYNANAAKIGSIDKLGIPMVPSLQLTNAARVVGNVNGVGVTLRDVTKPLRGGTEPDSSYYPSSNFTWLSKNTWGLSDYGFIVHKSEDGNTVSVLQPIYTSAPANPRLGTMALINGIPMWYNGTNWVYCDGETTFDKIDTNQGVANAGKFLVVGNDGNVTPTTISSWQGGSY